MIQNKIEKVSWVYKDYVIAKRIYKSTRANIFVLEGLEHNWNILNKFSNNDHIFVVISHNATEWNFNKTIKIIEQENQDLNLKNICYLANNEIQMKTAKQFGFESILFNHNSFLDENIYKITNNDERRKYNLVLNVRPEKWKRPYLANLVRPLAIIKGLNHRKDDYYDLTKLAPDFINENYLNSSQVVDVYNMSEIGGCFSAAEGACYTSSEFLLCGLPVVSTPSEGGRDFWYSEENSIIANDNESDIAEACARGLYNLKNGIWNRKAIRSRHIEIANHQRMEFINHIDKILNTSLNLLDGKAIFLNNFKNKMTEKINLNELHKLFD